MATSQILDAYLYNILQLLHSFVFFCTRLRLEQNHKLEHIALVCIQYPLRNADTSSLMKSTKMLNPRHHHLGLRPAAVVT